MCTINLSTLDWIWLHRREVRCAVDATSRLLKRYGSPRPDERGCRLLRPQIQTRSNS